MHTLNGKSYIGQTGSSLSRRTQSDFSGYKDCTVFYHAIQKYGHENIITTILCQCSTLAEANWKEQWYIKRYNTLAPNGYNLQSGGDNFNHSSESRQRMSVLRQGEFAPMYGKSHTLETKEKLSKSKRGKKNPMYGKAGELHHNYGTKRPDTAERNRQNTGEKSPVYGKSNPSVAERMRQQMGEKNCMSHTNRDKRRGQLFLFD